MKSKQTEPNAPSPKTLQSLQGELSTLLENKRMLDKSVFELAGETAKSLDEVRGAHLVDKVGPSGWPSESTYIWIDADGHLHRQSSTGMDAGHMVHVVMFTAMFGPPVVINSPIGKGAPNLQDLLRHYLADL